MQITNIREAKTQLSKLVERALEGEDVIIARRQADGPACAHTRQRHTPQRGAMEGQSSHRRRLRCAAG
jgi:antitoxin (DNA-binding transcriptional repressor) of toxin-antitoxin stability system